MMQALEIGTGQCDMKPPVTSLGSHVWISHIFYLKFHSSCICLANAIHNLLWASAFTEKGINGWHKCVLNPRIVSGLHVNCQLKLLGPWIVIVVLYIYLLMEEISTFLKFDPTQSTEQGSEGIASIANG